MTRLVAWLGGVAFVASLAYTFYFYALVLGDAAAGTASLPVAAAGNLMLFGVFAAHHSLFARDAVKQLVMRLIPAQLERSLYVWVASILLVVCLQWWRLVPGLVYAIDGPLQWAFYAIQLLGLHVITRGAGLIDPLELAGIHQAQRRDDEMVFRTDGPFGLVRHPIYFGWILMAFGTPYMTVNRLLFAAITSSYLVIAIPWEERSLVTAFGKRYRAYQAHVRWRLIPGIW